LLRTKQAGMSGLQPLTYAEIAAWAHLTDRQPLPHEVMALLTLDTEFRLSDG